MLLRKRRGLTMIETLISIALLSGVVLSVLGAFYVSTATTIRARHRLTAMNLAREYLDREISKGVVAGNYDLTADTAQTIDGITYTITRNPFPATDNVEGTGVNAVHYYTVGFQVTWNENISGTFGTVACSERVTTHVSSQH